MERCLPEYRTRYDVFRLGELQNFLDGHESPDFGLDRDEAAAERDRLQLRIYAEAITAFMKRQSARFRAMCPCATMRGAGRYRL